MDNQEKTKSKAGRPKKEIPEDQVLKLAERQWSAREIAAHFGVGHDLIHRRFQAKIEEARQHGVAKLKDVFWRHATGARIRDEHGNIVSTKTSERILIAAMDRYVGPVEQKVKQDGKIEVTISDYRSKKPENK